MLVELSCIRAETKPDEAMLKSRVSPGEVNKLEPVISGSTGNFDEKTKYNSYDVYPITTVCDEQFKITPS